MDYIPYNNLKLLLYTAQLYHNSIKPYLSLSYMRTINAQPIQFINRSILHIILQYTLGNEKYKNIQIISFRRGYPTQLASLFSFSQIFSSKFSTFFFLLRTRTWFWS